MTYDSLVKAHKDAIFREMLRVCGNREDSEDILVEALVTAYKESKSLRDEGAFRAWVCKIGRRLCWHLRHKKEIEVIFSESAVDNEQDSRFDPQNSIEEVQWRDCLQKAVLELGQTYKRVFVAIELEGASIENLATELNISVGATKSRLNRARKQVRESLEHSLCLSE